MQHLFTTPDELPQEAPEDPGAAVYVRVAIERGIDSAEAGEGLTYRAGHLNLHVGQRVEVPLGRGNKPAPGIVVAVGGAALLGDLAPAKAKPVLRATGPALPEPLVALARWMAEYYICPLGLVLATMLPASVKRGTGLVRRVEIEAVGPSEAAAVLQERRLSPSVQRAWEAIVDAAPAKPMEPRALAALIEAKNLGVINRLVEAGLLRRIERQVVRGREQIWQTERLEGSNAAPVLTDQQRRVVEGVGGTLGSFGVHLLRGVTGSGKTEVYMQIMQRVLDRGERALMLVPEISLTPQTAGRFLSRFGSLSNQGRVAVLHSGMPASERHRQWSLAASGRAEVVVGARSAIFAPLTNLGLIVVDEEHAGDYKQDQAPRYNARDVAIKRAQNEKCTVLLGSATPSLESWGNAMRRSGVRYALWELTQRVGGGALPRVEVVDLAVERRTQAQQAAKQGGNPREIHAVGPRLETALRATLRDGGQAILLLNRRGYSSYICCPDSRCGWAAGCDQCDTTMVLHRWREAQRSKDGPSTSGGQARELVRCHHCLSEQLVPRVCAVCGKKTVRLGVGTQRLEEELLRKLDGVLTTDELVRVDGDSMRTATDYFRTLSRFGQGDVKVMVGTQMIAKGLDFPNVRLVGVINADTGLSFPDFRSAERVFQLVSQVAGRAGRGEHPGLVIVQTMNPGEAAIELAARHDYVTFAKQELAIRVRAGLPPTTRMARVVVRDESHAKAESHAREIASALRAVETACHIEGPAPCPIARIANEYRFAVDITGPTAREVGLALKAVRTAGLLRGDLRTSVDVDPVALL